MNEQAASWQKLKLMTQKLQTKDSNNYSIQLIYKIRPKNMVTQKPNETQSYPIIAVKQKNTWTT
jgi:hypothetical protein